MKGSIICILIPNYSLGKQWGLYIILFKRSRRVKLDNVFFNKKNVIFPKKNKNMYRCLMAQQNFGFFLQSLSY